MIDMDVLTRFVEIHPFQSGEASAVDFVQDFLDFIEEEKSEEESTVDEPEVSLEQVLALQEELGSRREQYIDHHGNVNYRNSKRPSAKIDEAVDEQIENLAQRLTVLNALKKYRVMKEKDPSWFQKLLKKF